MAQSLAQFLLVVAFLTVAAAAPSCPVGWSVFGGSCYYIGAAGSNFTTAAKGCRSIGSELASIYSPEENTFVKSLLKDDVLKYALDIDTCSENFKGSSYNGGLAVEVHNSLKIIEQ
ncbi:snaclec bothrojaracin subunit beta [Plakobranchus ocellatus]|uniref:Snaclec bothrojaracin subunit beta n=1 Tax=Plakobranchus ocellatus TaxID=259542 RepID=A0AAV4BTP1_9GAST|nr:snaclec bothrojaracin subunit beta [Plakobranchus ocellatus]